MWVDLEGPKLSETSQIKTKTTILLILEKKMATYSSILALESPVNRGAWQATVHGGHKKLNMTWQLKNNHHL